MSKNHIKLILIVTILSLFIGFSLSLIIGSILKNYIIIVQEIK